LVKVAVADSAARHSHLREEEYYPREFALCSSIYVGCSTHGCRDPNAKSINMAHRSDNSRKYKHLTLVWVREAQDGLSTPKAPGATQSEADGPAQLADRIVAEAG